MGACSKFCEFASALVAAFGAFCLGCVIGWSSPAQPKIERGDFKFSASERESFYLGAMMTIGGAIVCIPMGFMINIIGRKFAMIVAVIPFIIGWCLLCFGKHIAFAFAARFFLGVGAGSFSVGAPVYTTEVAEVKFRGMFGSLFQMLIVIGIMYAFVIGALIDNGITMTAIIGLPCLPLLVMLFFVPFSPVFLLGRDKPEKAQKELQKLRGKNTDVTEEFNMLKAENQRLKDKQRPLCSTLCTGVSRKALFISIALMFAQQLGGINAFMFFSVKIFEAAKSSLESHQVNMLFGGVQVVATLIAIFVIDKLGRRILLIASAALDGISCIVYGVYFLMQENGTDVSNVAWLPIVFAMVYIIGFSIGLGPIPWLMIGELFEDDIKPFAASISATMNWVFAFIVTGGYSPFKDLAGSGPPFFLFGVVNILVIVFAIFVLPETKQKTIAEIQQAIAGKPKEPK